MNVWTEYAVRIRTGAGEIIEQPIEGPEPHRVGQYARRRIGDGSNRTEPDMDALRVRTVRATEWRRPNGSEIEGWYSPGEGVINLETS